MPFVPRWLAHGVAIVLILGGLGALPVRATPYWSPAEGDRRAAEMELSGAPAGEELLWLGTAAGERTDYLAAFSRVAHFLSVWQVSNPADPQFGGIREGEHLPNIIQTDNTSEAIWVWARYYELTGDDQYHQNLLDALTYSMNFPAYLEEGDSSPEAGYYRMYNCGWATRAELTYRDVYGDETYRAYGDSCASYIRHHYLVRPAYGGARFYNPPVYAWALGNLYYVGVRENQAAWRENAVEQARTTVKAWVEEDPALLATESWAMSGGATMWGLLNSYFSARPNEAPGWLATYEAYMDTTVNVGQFSNAWKAWYALGHRAVGETLDDAYHLGVHLRRTEELVAEDGDLDGGIPARLEDTDQMDQTWIANYLAFMGLDPLLPPAAAAPEPVAAAPTRLTLRAGPNPSPGGLRLAFDLPRATTASLVLFDGAGRLVARLAKGATAGGPHAVEWDGRDDLGRAAPSGWYRAVLTTPEGRASRGVLRVR
jgi:hypothetical protein